MEQLLFVAWAGAVLMRGTEGFLRRFRVLYVFRFFFSGSSVPLTTKNAAVFTDTFPCRLNRGEPVEVDGGEGEIWRWLGRFS